MKLNKDGPYYWVAHEDRLRNTGNYGANDGPGTKVEQELVARRAEIDVIGGVEDKEASYSYDDWALCKLDSNYYLLSTSGCSCPSPSETWRVEIGPATLDQIHAHVSGGHYDGYTVPKKQLDEFTALIQGEADRNTLGVH